MGIFSTLFSMHITQTVQVPASRRLTIDVPREIPSDMIIITFEPMVAKRTAKASHKPISQYLGILSPDTYGNGVDYQRKLRDEWDD